MKFELGDWYSRTEYQVVVTIPHVVAGKSGKIGMYLKHVLKVKWQDLRIVGIGQGEKDEHRIKNDQVFG